MAKLIFSLFLDITYSVVTTDINISKKNSYATLCIQALQVGEPAIGFINAKPLKGGLHASELVHIHVNANI